MILPTPEILAPAGSPQQLTAAVRAGADAVYLGAGLFNARRNAANFTDDELREAVGYCHERGVAVYFLMNTLVYDSELEDAVRLARLACSLSCDGVIIQDMAVAEIFRRCAPDMPIHASTQMTVHTPAAMPLLSQLGFSRAVLARELSLNEIKEIASASDVETEVFVHGAHCMSVSGQCFMSAALGTRSGNRGMCAQPCRLPFKSGSFDYCLSLKDMSLVSHLADLAKAGVCSFKIEGRMKRPEYCAAAVTVCRLSRDGQPIPEELSKKLEGIFSRNGFTDGYLTSRLGRGMFGHRTRDDAADSSLISSLHPLYRSEYQRVPISMELTLKKDTPCKLAVTDDIGNRVEVSGDISSDIFSDVDPSPLMQTGGTAYIAKAPVINNDGCSVRPSQLKALRREALTQLSDIRKNRTPVDFSYTMEPIEPHIVSRRPEIHAVISSTDQLIAAHHCDRVYLPLESAQTWLENAISQYGEKIAVEAPRGLFGMEERIKHLLSRAAELGVKYCMIHNIGLIDPVKDAGLVPCGGYGLNITNSYSLKVYEKLGLELAELSCELTVKQINALGANIARGVMVYGHMPLMLTRNCPAKLGTNCKNRPNCFITDRFGNQFPVRCREAGSSCSEVFNIIPLSIVDKLDAFRTIDSFFLRFTVENSVETEEIINCVTKNSPLRNKNFTRGLYYRGAE